jgi:hypothetical protein
MSRGRHPFAPGRRPGGNYTEPHYDGASGRTTFRAYVHWDLVGEFDSAADAVEAVRSGLVGDVVDLVARREAREG